MRGLGLNRELEGERALFVGDRGIGGVRGDRRQRRDLFRAAEHLRHLRERCAQLGFVHLREKFGRERRGHVAAVVEQRDEIGGALDRKNTSELQSLMRISYAVFCLKKKTK